MKTIRILPALIPFLFLAAGCRQDGISVQNTENGITEITAYCAESDGKTVLAEDATSVLWSPNDEISMFFNSSSVKFTSLNTEPAAWTVFQSEKALVFGGSEGSDKPYLYGVYPYSTANQQVKDTLVLSVPSSQVAGEGTFNRGSFPSVGRSKTTDIAFYNVCGGLRFTVEGEGITRVSFSGNNDEYLAGKVKVIFDEDGHPAVREVTDGAKTVTLAKASGEYFKAGEWYYISMLPAVLSKGFTINLYKGSDKAELKVDSAKEIKRSRFGELKEIDKGLIFKTDGSPEVPDPDPGSKDPASSDPEKSGVIIDDETSSDDNVANTEFDGVIIITYNSSVANVSGSVDGVSVSADGAYVTATNAGNNKVKYVLTGSSQNGGFKLYSEKKQAIELSDLTLKSTTGAAINNQSKKRTFVVIEGTNTLSDCSINSEGDYPSESDAEDMKAAFFSEAQLCFSGSGTLTVNAVGKAGITSDDYIRFLTGSNVTVNSSKGHGVRGKDAIIVSGGTVNVTLESTATGKKCFSSDSLTCFVGGNTTLVNKAGAGIVDDELTGAACIKSDKQFVMQGGKLTATASGKGCKCISGDEKGFFEGGTIICKATGANYGSSSTGWHGDGDNSVTSKAIKFDGNLEFSGTTVTATCSSHEAIESKGTIYISGGKVSSTSSDDAFNSASTMTISGGAVYAYSTGNDGLDSNGNLIIKGGTVYAIGNGSPEVAIDANSEDRYQVYIQGGNVIAMGGIESGASISQAVISTSWTRNAKYSLCDGDNVIYSFKAPSSGGTGLYMTAPSLVSGSSYSLRTSATVSGDESCVDGILSTGGTASGGSSASVTASTYSSGGGGNQPGGRIFR